MASDLLMLSLPDNSVSPGDIPCGDDEDVAGYHAMMKELPTIVSMSGLLDGDFDELHEIQNLLAPVSDDDDIDEGYEAARKAVDAAESTNDAYIQAMVPNPIPTDDFSDGYEVSARAAALDENLGFPSAALITPTTDFPTSLSVRAPANKRDHNQLEAGLVTPVPTEAVLPLRKKSKLHSPSTAKGPATLRTSLDGVSAPNPLLFGRPIKLPSETALVTPVAAAKAKTTKVTLKARSSPKSPKTKTSKQIPCNLPPPVLKKVDPPKLRKPTKFVSPEQILSYPVPTVLVEKIKAASNARRPPLCKLVFKAKVESKLTGSTHEAVARISAPPQKTKPGCVVNNSNNNPTASATASKKKASNNKTKKKSGGSPSSVPKKKVTAVVQAKKNPIVVKNPLATQVTIPDTQVKVPVPAEPTEVVASEPRPPPPPLVKTEMLMVANPLDHIPPPAPEPTKVVLPPPVKSPTPAVSTPTDCLTLPVVAPPAIVSSNSSAASFSDDIPEELTSDPAMAKSNKSPAAKSTTNKPLSKDEKVQACRDRNRQHARNTRLRKKAYVEELKRSMMELVEQRDQDLEKKKKQESQKRQHREKRKRVLQDFLELRGRNEQDEAKWEKLVKDSKTFQLTLPLTTFQTMAASSSPSADEDQVLVGIKDVMADAGHLASVLQSLGTSDDGPERTPVYLQYQSEQMPLLMDGTMGILSWKATSFGAMSQGARAELSSCGTIRGVFCPDTDKLVSAVLLFDTGAIQAQLSKPHHV
ncbi:expressed unknown protein [Seminavis robusta]|uniref:BZIP domain-containing protein n=1 Tax=Seminavis robusta TaxID=568900 RepID=A0A9N8D9L8_9STRA|nr:expressed unknown protein [Seminavis robusta]|eukprot:Sro42_g025810.1 n/a (755) ;mRNA; r:122698-125168